VRAGALIRLGNKEGKKGKNYFLPFLPPFCPFCFPSNSLIKRDYAPFERITNQLCIILHA
jgi:hypothetical protein